MKVAQNDETNPDTQPVRPPHAPSIPNTQLSPSGTSARTRETPGILSRMFPPFVGITTYRVRAHLAQRTTASCSVLHLIALLFIMFPPSILFPVDPETAGEPLFNYGVDDLSLPEQPGKPPP